MRFLIFPWLLAGCTPEFNSVESACAERFPGQDHASRGADEFVHRINCYRRLAGLSKAGLDPSVQQAVAAHGDYMALHEVVTDEEIPGREGFTGEDALARLAAAGLDTSNLPSLGAWIALDIQEEGTVSDLVDRWVADPFQRQLVLQRGWRSGGFAAVDRYIYANILYDFPSGRDGARPTVYPADGQLFVPTRWESPYAGIGIEDGIPDGTPLGFPITISVGSWQYVEDANPYGIELESATLDGPVGEVALYTVGPADEVPITLLSTLVLVPAEPLLAGANYRLTAKVRWADGTTEVRAVFRTDEGAFDTADTGG